ncbi:MAG: hypothetical protein ACYC0T_09410 [Ramlibacter sp.]
MSTASVLGARIAGLFGQRFWQELLRNSAHLPIVTAWSERCAPETAVQALNAYHAASEPVLRRHAEHHPPVRHRPAPPLCLPAPTPMPVVSDAHLGLGS